MTRGRIVKPAPDENSTWRGLFAAVVLQAVVDLRGNDLVQALDAAVFLTGRDIGTWMEGAGLPYSHLDLMDVPRAWGYMNKQGNQRWRAYRKTVR